MDGLTLERRHEALREKAAEIARNVVAPTAARHDRDISIPTEMLRALHKEGLLALCVPRELGGGGVNIVLGQDPISYLVVLEELGKVDMASTHCYQVHAHAVQMLAVAATVEQQKRYFGPVVEAGEVISWTATEPGGTARGHYGMVTEARPTGDGLEVTGEKTYGTLASVAAWTLLHAALPDLPAPQNMIMFMVPKGAVGFDVDVDWWNPVGMRAAVSPRVWLRGVKVPRRDIIQDGGFYARDNYGSRWHLAFGATHLGAAQGILDFICEYVPKRGTGGNPHAQRSIGEMVMRIEAARGLLYKAARLWEGDRIDIATAERYALIGKLFAMTTAEWIVNEAIRVAGSSALFEQFPLSRQIRNIHVQSTHANLHNTAQAIGRARLGLDFDPANQQ
jgi:alkylation response protein AidB-like acyl-CoA dehydrogenase